MSEFTSELAGISDLERRLSRRIEEHKGIQLSAHDLDLFVISGAYEALRKAATDFQRQICEQRIEERQPKAASKPHADKTQAALERAQMIIKQNA